MSGYRQAATARGSSDWFLRLRQGAAANVLTSWREHLDGQAVALGYAALR